MVKSVLVEIVRVVFGRGGLLVGCIPAVVTCLIPAGVVCLDTVVFDLDCGENGIVEVIQSSFVLAVVFALGVVAYRREDIRGGLLLAVGFFVCVFIREQDAFLDRIYHGAWLPFALAATVLFVVLASRRLATIPVAFAHIRKSRYFPLLTLGLFVVLAFSRLFGYKAVWVKVVGTDDFRLAKHAAEEGAELLGYSILLFWAIAYCRECLKKKA